MNKKALLLFSGGLDSLLCAAILKEKGVKVTPVCFYSYFFDCKKALEMVKQIGLKLKVVDISKSHLKMIKDPKYGRGVGMNPCVDCHLLMLKTAKQIMKKEGYDIIATGEVLGQRPFSQSGQALELIEKRAGLKGLILRPLSANLLEETKFGIDGFYGISGKSRKEQLHLVEKFKIKNIPMPAGGCILTDAVFSERLKELLKIKKSFNGDDVQLLKLGRVFFNDSFFVVVARNEKECKELIKERKRGDIILEPHGFSGPTVLIRKTKKSSRDEMIDFASELLIKFSKNASSDPIIKILPSL
jgi:tRNA-uridine 2-sulfurtransferase